jgi:hypothetical protein
MDNARDVLIRKIQDAVNEFKEITGVNITEMKMEWYTEFGVKQSLLIGIKLKGE